MKIEFWAASIKVIAIVGWLIYALCMVCGAGQTGPVGFRYWRNPGAFGPGILVSNPDGGKFLGWLSSLVNAAFTFRVPSLSVLLLVSPIIPERLFPEPSTECFPYCHFLHLVNPLFGYARSLQRSLLSSTDSYVSKSPFIIAIINSGTKVLPSIFNAVILTHHYFCR